jgi:hypothetical protein
MYKVIGGDNKEYGPVTSDEARRWIAEGRLSAQSLAQLDGSGEWKPLTAFAEFVDALRAQTGARATPGVLAPPPNAADWSAQILARRPELQIGRCLSRSWHLWTANFGLLSGAAFLLWTIGFVCQLNLITGAIYWILKGVFYGGLYLVFVKHIRSQQASVGQAFAGFGPAFAQLLLAGVVGSILTGLGFVFCIVPGIYLFVAWQFSLPLVADKGLEFWSAMELSRKTVTRVWMEVFGLLICAFLPFLLVYLVAETKITITFFSAIQPLLASDRPDITRLMQTVFQLAKSSLPLFLLIKVAFMLNLPFALGALMYAYEDLFGARPASAA